MTSAGEHVRPPTGARLAPHETEEQASLDGRDSPDGHAPPDGPPDLAIGAFSEAAPWDLTGKPLPWRDGVDAP